MLPVWAKRNGKKVVLACLHWRVFPPVVALMDEPGEALWAKKAVSSHDFQQYLIWKKVCGRKQMDAEGCQACALAHIMTKRNHLPVLVSLDGTRVIPTTDIPTADSLPKNRGNFIQMMRPKKDKPDG